MIELTQKASGAGSGAVVAGEAPPTEQVAQRGPALQSGAGVAGLDGLNVAGLERLRAERVDRTTAQATSDAAKLLPLMGELVKDAFAKYVAAWGERDYAPLTPSDSRHGHGVLKLFAAEVEQGSLRLDLGARPATISPEQHDALVRLTKSAFARDGSGSDEISGGKVPGDYLASLNALIGAAFARVGQHAELVALMRPTGDVCDRQHWLSGLGLSWRPDNKPPPAPSAPPPKRTWLQSMAAALKKAPPAPAPAAPAPEWRPAQEAVQIANVTLPSLAAMLEERARVRETGIRASAEVLTDVLVEQAVRELERKARHSDEALFPHTLEWKGFMHPSDVRTAAESLVQERLAARNLRFTSFDPLVIDRL